jgi:hypothetical protein
VGVSGQPQRGSDPYHRGAHPPLRRLVASAQPRAIQREGKLLGGAWAIVPSPLSYAGSTNGCDAGRSRDMPVQKPGACAPLAHPASVPACVLYPMINSALTLGGQLSITQSDGMWCLPVK